MKHPEMSDDIIKASEEVIKKLEKMSDEELLDSLENCEDKSLAYAIDHTIFDKQPLDEKL